MKETSPLRCLWAGGDISGKGCGAIVQKQPVVSVSSTTDFQSWVVSAPRRASQFGHLKAGFHFVPEGHAIVARRFIAGLAINKVRVPEGRLKLVLGSYESGVPDRFEVKISAPRSEFRRPSGTQAM